MVRKARYILEKYTINPILKVYDKILEKIFEIDDWVSSKTSIRSPIALLISFALATFIWSWVKQNNV